MHAGSCRAWTEAFSAVGLVAALVLLSASVTAEVASLPTFNVDIRETSVSGLSSGGFMAVQFDVAFSSFVKGAGIVAGGPWFCARGRLDTATTVCSCTALPFLCRVAPGATGVPGLIRITERMARKAAIDATSNLTNQKIWMFSGTADTLVPQPIMNDLVTYYQHYVSGANIRFDNSVPAQHSMPTDHFGNACDALGPPYINNCNFDAAGELLKWIYGSTLNPKNDGTLSGRFVEFDQRKFLANPTVHGMARTGFLYVPASCDAPGDSPCRLHVVFHGCLQDPTNVQDKFIRDTGYNEWADTNNIIVLYPQAAPIFPLQNPNACWDWWGYDDANYATRRGRQMAAVMGMINRITGLQ